MQVTLRPDECELSVVIPALDEAPNLAHLLPALREVLDALAIDGEILVVCGATDDDTDAVAARVPGARAIHEGLPGYGAAILRGVSEANGEYVLTMDADLSHPAGFVESLWAVREQADITIASRYVEGGAADQPWFRYQLSRLLNGFFRVGLAFPVQDMSSGFRLYRKRLFESLDLEYTNFVILVEILLKAYARGQRIQETGFHYRPRGEGGSHARILKFGLDYLRLFGSMWRLRNSIEFPDYDWRAYDSRIGLQRFWQRRRHAIIRRLTPGEGRGCDVGCGSSRILADLPGAVGIDLRHAKLAFMRRTGNPLVQADGLRLPFDDAAFDWVVCSEVIEHVPDEGGRLIDELTRVLRPGGTLILGTPDYGGWQWPMIEWLYVRVAPGAYGHEHVTHYTFDSLTAALRDRGYTVEDHDWILRAELVLRARKPT